MIKEHDGSSWLEMDNDSSDMACPMEGRHESASELSPYAMAFRLLSLVRGNK